MKQLWREITREEVKGEMECDCGYVFLVNSKFKLNIKIIKPTKCYLPQCPKCGKVEECSHNHNVKFPNIN